LIWNQYKYRIKTYNQMMRIQNTTSIYVNYPYIYILKASLLKYNQYDVKLEKYYEPKMFRTPLQSGGDI